jgi:hypothetical protein
MSDFGKLLKASRFASMAKPLAKSRGSLHPSHQVVETRDAALARQEWGLKYALPAKLKSRYITLNDVDSLERLVDFEAGGGDHYRRLRFQELGVVPQRESPNALYESKPVNPLFQDSIASTQSNKTVESVLKLQSNEERQKIDFLLQEIESLRPQFKEYVLKNHAKELKEKSFTGERFQDAAVAFLKQYKTQQNVNKIASLKREDGFKFAGTGGLSYALKGRLRTTPNGVVHRESVPARSVGKSNVALGGFIADFKTVGHSEIDRATVFAVEPTKAVIRPNGAINITASVVKTGYGRERSITSPNPVRRLPKARLERESWSVLSDIINSGNKNRA